MKVRRLDVTQTRIFRSDVLPVSALLSTKLGSHLVSQFGFGDVRPNLVEGGLDSIIYARGSLELDDERSVLIISMAVEPRRIVSAIHGPSADADEFFARIVHILAELGYGEPETLVPVVAAEESVCVCTLDINFGAMFSPTLHEFVADTVAPATASPYADHHELMPQRLGFRVRYKAAEDVTSFEASLADKSFVLEPRTGAGDGEPLYYASLPGSTDALIGVLKELETRFPPA